MGSMEGYAFLATAAWWLRLGSLGLAEYAAPFLAFDETTLAAVAGFNSVVNVLDVDFANAISNTALSTPSMLLLYTLFAAEVTTGATSLTRRSLTCLPIPMSECL